MNNNTLYIHRHFKSYKKYGLNFARKGNESRITNIYNNFLIKRNEIKSKNATDDRLKEIKELEGQYQAMLFGQEAKEINFREVMVAALNSLLQEKFGEGVASVKLDNNTIKATANKKINSLITQEIKKIGQYDQIYTETIKKRAAALSAVIETIEKESGKDLADLNSKLAKKNKDLGDIKDSLTAMMELDKSRVSVKQQQTAINTINEIINIINSLKNNTSLLAAVQGDIGEWLAPWIENFALNQANKAMQGVVGDLTENLKTMAQSSQKGSLGMYVVYDSATGAYVGEYETKKAAEEAVNIHAHGTSLTIKYHVNKTDAIINFNNKEERLSIKNYSSLSGFQNHGISLVSNTPLGSVLKTGISQIEIAHMTNAFAEHVTEDGTAQSLRDRAQLLIEALLAQVAVKGYTQKNAPTAFLAIDNSAKKVKVYDIQNLIYSILDENNSNITGSKVNISKVAITGPKGNFKEKTDQMIARSQAVINNFTSQKMSFYLYLNV